MALLHQTQRVQYKELMILVQKQLVQSHKPLKIKKTREKEKRDPLPQKKLVWEMVESAKKYEERCGANRISIGERIKKESFNFPYIYSSASLSETMSLNFPTPA